MKTEITYKNFKLVTYKNKSGSYTTYVFNGGIKAVFKVTYKFKKDSVGIAKIKIDNNEIDKK